MPIGFLFRLAAFASVLTAAPSVATVSGRQLLVQQRRFDGSLAAQQPWELRCVAWSPASTDTNTSKADPLNATVRRQEYFKWRATDVPLLRSLGVNCVRMFLDPGFDAAALALLDDLYGSGIMTIINVDDGIGSLTRAQQAVAGLKDHPGVLMWMIGSEWNINLYFGAFPDVPSAAARTQQIALAIKQLDTNHPVAASYGEIDINANGLRLADTQNVVNVLCPAVDIWALNLYRGNTFTNVYSQWASISTKPIFIGEFGTDAYRNDRGSVEEAMQAGWAVSLWNNLSQNLSARDSSKIALGGALFASNDEWWKIIPNTSQETGGFVLNGGHPDNFANEEFFGAADIHRRPRRIFRDMQPAFDSRYAPSPGAAVFHITSGGGNFGNAVIFYRDGVPVLEKTGAAGGGRGFTVAGVNPATRNIERGPMTFDTWSDPTGANMLAMVQFLSDIPSGWLVLLGVADEAGLNQFPPNSCEWKSQSWIATGIAAIESLGSKAVRSYCYRDSFALLAVKGAGRVVQERLSKWGNVTAGATFPLPAPSQRSSRIGAVGAGQWVLDFDGSGGWNGTPLDRVSTFTLGSGEIPVTGDWNGSGTAKIGVYLNGSWRLDFNGNGVWDGPAVDREMYLGGPGYEPLTGDWSGTGSTKIGAHNAGTWLLDFNGNFIWDGAVDDRLLFWGGAGYAPVLGDWDGSGTTKIGVHQNGVWILDFNGNLNWDGSAKDKLFYWGGPGFTPVTGDWNGDGASDVAVYQNGTWIVDYNGNLAWDGVAADRLTFFGGPGYLPRKGDWAGVGQDRIGVYLDGLWLLDFDGSYAWTAGGDRLAFFGGAGQTPVAGQW